MISKKILENYIVLCYGRRNSIFLSKLNKIYKYNIDNDKIELIAKFQKNKKHRFSKINKKLRRLLRSDIRFAFWTRNKELIVIYNNKFHSINLETKQIIELYNLPRGSRPLNMTFINNELNEFENGLYFGEYFSNPEKKSVNIYKIEKKKLKIVYTFKEGLINHIHNLVIDKFNQCMWILVGDFDNSAAIYRAKNNFKDIKCILSGKQAYRACEAFPLKEGLLYATDSQFEQNYIKLLKKDDREKWISENICPINGPAIFATKFKEKLAFSTSVEAINTGNKIQKYLRRKSGPGIIKDVSEIKIGNLKSGFTTFSENKKDCFPFIFFQFGNIIFPRGENNTNFLIYSNIALKDNDLCTEIIKFD